jgi:hypothetical protein
VKSPTIAWAALGPLAGRLHLEATIAIQIAVKARIHAVLNDIGSLEAAGK